MSRLIASLVAQEADRRVAIWLRVRVGGQRMTELAKEYGYRDGSGVHLVVHRLWRKRPRKIAISPFACSNSPTGCQVSRVDRMPSSDHPLTAEFEDQMISLVREYKGDGEYLSVHHPDEPGAKDDAPDRTVLMPDAATCGGDGGYSVWIAL